MRTAAFNLNIDGADVARIFLSVPSARKVVVDLAYPNMVDVRIICPSDRALPTIEKFLVQHYAGRRISIRTSEPAQDKPCEATFKKWFEKTLADQRERT